jgi:hypothetical protein
MPNSPEMPRLGSAYALTRFFLRLSIFSAFAAFGSQGFGRTLGSLLVLGFCYCIVAAAIRREQPFGPVLTHFDEAAAYAGIAVVAAWMS